ncbi:GNAT family N-acetyltransferase [Streptomyces sp. NPDC017230]|uniref:GNAT family N-acetyltransferase n=1 Tax=unclassified Streptomyces TaxID=2593676 RepID=UPI003788DD92
MIVRLGQPADLPGFVGLAAQVEHWFGPMVDDPGFHRAVEDHVRHSMALVAESPASGELLGGLLFGVDASVHHVHWLVVDRQARGLGAGKRLMTEAVRRFVRGPGTVEVVTFGADHPGAVESGARVFYERLGFRPAEVTGPGPEGGSRQVYRREVAGPHDTGFRVR